MKPEGTSVNETSGEGTFATYPSLRDRVVLVSGGSSGIGAGIVEHFCRQQARVAFLDLDEAGAASLRGALAATGAAEPLFLPCDLRDIPALEAAIRTVGERLGPIEVLVNNAARDDRHALGTVTPERFDELIAVNLRHQFFAAQAVAPGMQAMGRGSIINLGSVSWMIGQGGMPVYLASKSAINGLTRALARDLGPSGIRVNTVVPGWIMTERQVALWLDADSEAELMRMQCLKEKLYPADIARMVLWLAADDSRLVTNQNFIIDGGRI
jgi:NAD(P)-dependent dehydrogenase (short-subunit alcohol dehydrogenase family)